jgi:altronate dehydratase large subunit
MECGHSDASSGIVANPLAGDLADLLIAAGGAAVFSETLEWTGTEPSLYARCLTPEIAARLEALVTARHRIARDAGKNIRLGNPGPQNHDGGITTLEEKSHGAVSKGGTGPIAGALEQAEPLPETPGLYLMDTPTLSPESISSMVAGGAQLVIFTTGQGNPYGSAMAPTIKLTANPQTAARLPRQIDFDASAVFSGMRLRGELLPDLAGLVMQICEGATVSAETLEECDEAISRLLPSV